MQYFVQIFYLHRVEIKSNQSNVYYITIYIQPSNTYTLYSFRDAEHEVNQGKQTEQPTTSSVRWSTPNEYNTAQSSAEMPIEQSFEALYTRIA